MTSLLSPLHLSLLCASVPLWASTWAAAREEPVTLRVASFDIQDIRTTDLKSPDNPRLKQLADVIQHLRPNILLLSGIAYDTDGAPGFTPGEIPGSNAKHFADRYLAIAQSEGIEPLHFTAFMAPTNSGLASGLDLDQNGSVVTTYPPPAPPRSGPNPEARDFSNDCWGPGDFPGQHALALLIDSRLTLQDVRAFRLLPWDYMPGAAIPESTKPELRQKLRLSSTTHWDTPIRLPNGATLHLLCSAPAPFDSPDRLAARRNHDEIRFWADYTDGSGSYIVDDTNHPGSLSDDAPFVILGDLQAAPKQPAAFKDPIAILTSCRRVNAQIIPQADLESPGLGPADTSASKLRTDYILPSRDIAIVAAGVWRHHSGPFPSDHYPVWMDLRVNPPPAPPAAPSPSPSPDR